VEASQLERIAAQIQRSPFARSLGIRLEKLEEGHAVATMKVREDMLNFQGNPHGGAIFALADTAFGAAGNSHGTKAVALDMTISYVSAVEAGALLRAEAREESLGNRIGFYRITVTDQAGSLVANVQATVYRKREPLPGFDGS